MAADDKYRQSVLNFARTYAPHFKSVDIALTFGAGISLPELVNAVRRIADENQMVIEWGYYDKRLAPDADEDAESVILAGVYYDGGPEETSLYVTLRIPGAAYELCETVWGRPQVIECFDPWDIGELSRP